MARQLAAKLRIDDDTFSPVFTQEERAVPLTEDEV